MIDLDQGIRALTDPVRPRQPWGHRSAFISPQAAKRTYRIFLFVGCIFAVSIAETDDFVHEPGATLWLKAQDR